MIRRVGLHPSTPLPNTATQVAATVLLLRRTTGIRWSKDPADLARVLQHLRAQLGETA